MILVHATCIDLGHGAVLLRGPSGCGKSDLALRLIDGGGRLVSDDQVEIVARDGRLFARAPEAIRDMMEVRGIGLVRLEAVGEARLLAVFDLCRPEEIDRLPEPRTEEICAIALPLFSIAPFEASAAAKLRLAAGLAPHDLLSAQEGASGVAV